MFAMVQQAYYRDAVNPSDVDVLVALSERLQPPIDVARFASDIASAEVEHRLQDEFTLRRELGVRSFPSLVLERNGSRRLIMAGHADASEVLAALAL